MTLSVSKRRGLQSSYIAISNFSTLYIHRITRRYIKQFQLHITQYYTVRNINLYYWVVASLLFKSHRGFTLRLTGVV
jgi:hypothetical protein